MTAAEVKDALRRRHPALAQMGGPGPWTTIEEWAGIDLLAIAAWTQPKPARARHARIGYEVKVSRSDYRRELLKPLKRAWAVGFCHEFYFAVPEGLLTADELAFAEPEDAGFELFEREPCPNASLPWIEHPCRDGKRHATLVGPVVKPYGWVDDTRRWVGRVWRPEVDYRCEACDGRGYLTRSRVEREWPTLWVPRDVGLVTITQRGVRVERKAPLCKEPKPLGDSHLGDLIRWVSWRPDPRHVARDEQEAMVA